MYNTSSLILPAPISLSVMDLVKCLNMLHYLQKIALMKTCNFLIKPNGNIVVQIQRLRHLVFMQIFIICCLFYFTKYTGSRATFIISTMEFLLRFFQIVIPTIIYASDTFVERKMIRNYKDWLRIDSDSRKNLNDVAYGKINMFIWKVLLLFMICVVLKMFFYLRNTQYDFAYGFFANVVNILIGVITIKWTVYMHVCGHYIEKLNEKILHLIEPNTDWYNIAYVSATVNKLKILESLYSGSYRLVKKIEATLSVNIYLTICYSYLKILWNFYFVYKYIADGKVRYFDVLASNLILVFPLFGIIFSSMALQRKFEKLLENFYLVTSKMTINTSAYLEQTVRELK